MRGNLLFSDKQMLSYCTLPHVLQTMCEKGKGFDEHRKVRSLHSLCPTIRLRDRIGTSVTGSRLTTAWQLIQRRGVDLF